jgi:hypothetical protein
MKKFLFLIAIAAFCLNCGTKTTVNNTNQTNTNTPSPTNTPTPANTNKPANTNAESNKNETSSKEDGKSNPELDFTIVNKTGYDIKELSIGATGTGEWTKEDEVLKGRTFADGSSMDIKFSPRATAAKWDIKVEWTDGSKGVEWLNLNLTEIEKVTLTYDRATDKTTANIE